MASRLQQFVDNVAANITSWLIISIVPAATAAMVAVFSVFTHGLSRWEQAGILAISTLVLVALGFIVYIGLAAGKQQRKATGLPPPPVQSSPPSLRDKVAQLAHDIAVFLRELGPRPEIHVDPGMSTEEILAQGSDDNRPERVHHGYMRHFRDRAVNLMHELGEKGITNTGIESYQVDSPEIQREGELREFVKRLFLVVANMDIESELGGIKSLDVVQTPAKQPRLQCGNLESFVLHEVPGEKIIAAGIKVVNGELRYSNTAHNIRASIKFRHALGDVQVVNPGIWYKPPNDFSNRISLDMGEQTLLLIFFWNAYDVKRDFRAANQLPSGYARAPKLEYGQWNIEVTLEADNIPKFEHRIRPVTLTPTHAMPGCS